MEVSLIKIQVLPNQVIELGHVGENNARELIFDISDWTNDPRIGAAGTVSIYLRQGGSTFKVNSNEYTFNDGKVNWVVGAINLQIVGRGKLELVYNVNEGEILSKSKVWLTNTLAPIDVETTDPPQIPMWSLDEIYQKIDEYIAQIPLNYVSYTTAQELTDAQKETARNNIGAVDEADVEEIIEPLIVGYDGEITLSGDETLVLEIKSGRLYHDSALYTGDIVFSDDGDNAVTLNVNKGFTYSEGTLYIDTVKLSGDDSTLFISFENGLVKNISTDSPNLDGTVHYDREQELTNEEKEVARKNIGINLNAIAKGCMLLLSFDDAVYEGKNIRAVVSDFRISNKPFILPQFYYMQEEAPVYNWDFEEVGVIIPGLYVISGGISRPIFTANLKSGETIRVTLSYATQPTGDRIMFLTEV